MTLERKTIRYEVRCPECGRRFDDMEAFDAHMRSTPHKRDMVQVIHAELLGVRRDP